MRIAWSQLNRLPVVTESGKKLGLVEGVEVDVDSHAIVHYVVKPGSVVKALFAKDLHVSPSEVVSITETQMTVKDTVTPVGAQSEKTRLALATAKGDVDLSERS